MASSMASTAQYLSMSFGIALASLLIVPTLASAQEHVMEKPQPRIIVIAHRGDPVADRLLAEDPLALLIGFALDQQVTVQKAFSGPLDLRARLGHLDAAKIAAQARADADRFAQRIREHFAWRRVWNRVPMVAGREPRVETQ